MLWLVLLDDKQHPEFLSALGVSLGYATATAISVLGMMISVVVILKTIDEELAVTRG